LSDNLGRHPAAALAAAEAATTAAAEAAATGTAAEAAAAPAATAEAVTAAEAIAATAEAVTAAETILSSEERIELVLSEPLLVASPSATTSVKTHVYERTFAAPLKHSPGAWTIRAKRQENSRAQARPFPAIITLTRV
jgi:hypothetical protein